MLTEITKSDSQIAIRQTPHYAVTPFSLMLVMAYLHYYTPKRLPDSRFMAPDHLRQLAHLINKPDNTVRSIRQHKPLAAHFALLYAANFLPNAGDQLALLPTVSNWLHAEPQTQIERLLQLVETTTQWSQTLSRLNLQETITEDYTLYLSQSLTHQLQAPPIMKGDPPATWQNTTVTDDWLLTIPPHLPLWLQFDLRQLGHWGINSILTCTPTSIVTAIRRGYGPETIQWLLETATLKPMPETKQIQLHQWNRRIYTYQLRTVHLLTTAQDEQMANLLRRKLFRSAVIEQLAPRHAIVSHNIGPQLEKYLAKQQYLLAYNSPYQQESVNPEELEANSAWLAARIMIGLGQIVPLPCPAPNSLLEHLENQLDATQKTELEAMATTFLQNIREAIHGRDAFLPAEQPPSSTLIQTIRSAIIKEQAITLTYKAIGELKASQRRVQPLRLDQRGKLYYLYAYCFRTEMNLTFRLDRIKEIV